MAGWEEHTEHFLGLRVFDGGHFYFQHDRGPLLRQIERDAATALEAARTAGRPAAGLSRRRTPAGRDPGDLLCRRRTAPARHRPAWGGF
ncbi:hypothetical protein ABZV31_32725 [Streptomyces sp. NPDC005202]|uniref:hypothetical protein n=1 Tax=Streptomyces sp. NPDC005202 TaxID=3157021 RepID=UPI0033AE4296